MGQDKVAGKPTDALEKTAAPASPKPAAKENKSLGLSSGDLAYKEEDAWAQGSGEGARVAAGPKDAPPPAPAASAAPAATSVKGSLDGLGGLGSTGNVSPQRESLGLSVKSKKSSKAMAPSADAPELNDEVAANSENRVQSSRKFDDDAMNGPASEESEQAQKVEAALGQARQAAKAGDRQGEVNAALAVLKAGATGYQRTEALKRLCDAFEAEGNQGSADAYCGMLLQEFPNTVAAKTVVTRRAARERALQEDAKNAGAKSKAKAAPSEAVPAKAY